MVGKLHIYVSLQEGNIWLAYIVHMGKIFPLKHPLSLVFVQPAIFDLQKDKCTKKKCISIPDL